MTPSPKRRDVIDSAPKRVSSMRSQSGTMVMDVNLVPLRQSGTKRPLFCFPGAGGEEWVFHQFAQCMREGQPVYFVNMRPLYEARTNFVLEQLASTCLELVREKQ